MGQSMTQAGILKWLNMLHTTLSAMVKSLVRVHVQNCAGSRVKCGESDTQSVSIG